MGSFTSSLQPTRDRTRHAAPQVFEQLREAIINLELAPGTVLSRQELQLRFGLSSTPIRDALMKLAEESLVDIFPQHATMVSRIDLDHARQAAFLRRSIEVEVAYNLASDPDPELVARLRQNLKLQRAFAEAGDLVQFNATDRAMHRMMYDAAGVPDLWTVMQRRNGHIERLRRLHLPMKGKVDQTIRDHTAIVEAIAAGDPATACREVRDHLSRSLAFSAEIRARFPGYFKD
ncbi:GntR family transcriptional regulator [Ferrovibrio sp.]|uniref:GntR family transcriptional regulator n=1 Tax=Ferrovibrio sp. TaxID=1917215 RepID=UPI002635121D|nr:GntR family transcriptional regulator [Ferrovibrio sp.]